MRLPAPLRFLLVMAAAALCTAGWMVYLRGVPTQPPWADWTAVVAGGPVEALAGLRFRVPGTQGVEVQGAPRPVEGGLLVGLRAHYPELRATMPFPYSPRLRLHLKTDTRRMFDALDTALRAASPGLSLRELRFTAPDEHDPQAAAWADPPVRAPAP